MLGDSPRASTVRDILGSAGGWSAGERICRSDNQDLGPPYKRMHGDARVQKTLPTFVGGYAACRRRGAFIGVAGGATSTEPMRYWRYAVPICLMVEVKSRNGMLIASRGISSLSTRLI